MVQRLKAEAQHRSITPVQRALDTPTRRRTGAQSAHPALAGDLAERARAGTTAHALLHVTVAARIDKAWIDAMAPAGFAIPPYPTLTRYRVGRVCSEAGPRFQRKLMDSGSKDRPATCREAADGLVISPVVPCMLKRADNPEGGKGHLALIERDGAPHGLFATHKDRFTKDLLACVKGQQIAPA